VKLLFAFLALLLAGVSAYPIPVACKGKPHLPLDNMIVIQRFGAPGPNGPHVGVDLKTGGYKQVYSTVDGIVMWSEENVRVYGRSIFILGCDGFGQLYAHLSERKVVFGEVVQSGQLIGLSGGDPNDDIDGDGWGSGAHLHWEVRVPGHLENNLYNINPEIYWNLINRPEGLLEAR
jgi:murein DD-endopeptidase MepM/ murein hydrolase activator NlpD